MNELINAEELIFILATAKYCTSILANQAMLTDICPEQLVIN